MVVGGGGKRFRGRAPQALNSRANSTAGARDLFVGFSGDALLVFRRAACGKNQMSVGVDEAGKHHAPAQVEFFGATRRAQALDAATRANGSDAVVMNEQSAIANNGEIGKGASAPGHGAAQGNQLRTAGNQPIRHVELSEY
jgi:hypothetical protein